MSRAADRGPRGAHNPAVRGQDRRPLTLVFGGTFDPPHRGHTTLPPRVAAALGATRLLYVPAGRSPFKLDHEQSPPADRLAMLRLAVRGLEAVEVDATEAEAGDDRPSYTVQTLRRLAAERPDERFALLIGTDQLFVFPQWHAAEALAALAPPAVMVRPPAGRAAAAAWLDHEAPRWLRDAATLVDVPEVDASSTAIRAALRRGERPPSLAAEVAEYARRRNLYPEV
ncbi:nicotinate (nicotinamide) nucleotide adenylyltransferase [Phycisphaera mikurensis]|uniref:Probable nicotinate-nucleotide adenylyltransferase n=1 Tax=Phycisphaera mikurensis (strain NBRC 102666 / KCTC 22515 / FYK2301M01) TaxID=1142394 RepID=I0IF40_PHYMF|nr:nicotinate (nicotinamide) nucleotide adenylyltransferase [Phycisphaera mikurensis]MBB6440726.1 nicotinate-nucleotide adenylyltransferase [Phycisphaera mikurensis]BAM03878.1 nicotinate-nucleotide adenylyltransferase [Phycisphaera mikurensis NBRC 102666]